MTAKLTASDIDALEALLAKATADPWYLSRFDKTTLQISDSTEHENGDAVVHWMGFDAGDKTRTVKHANAQLIVALRNVAPALIAAARQNELNEAILMWLLWHHQGGSSPIGQPIRKLLGIGENDHLSAKQLAAAKSIEKELAK